MIYKRPDSIEGFKSHILSDKDQLISGAMAELYSNGNEPKQLRHALFKNSYFDKNQQQFCEMLLSSSEYFSQVESMIGGDTSFVLSSKGLDLMNKWGDYSKYIFKLMDEEEVEFKAKSIQNRLNELELIEKSIMHKRFLGVELFVWITLVGVLISIISLVISLA